jgi:PPOX class probable F420-dependent enzyme
MTQLPDDVRDLVLGPNYGHLATVLPDGSPHTVPVWVAMEGDRIAFLTDPSSRKGRNVERDPRVAISITQQDRPNVMAQVRGRVTERLDGDPAWAIIDRMSQDYLGQPYPLRTDRVIYLIEVDHAWGMAF